MKKIILTLFIIPFYLNGFGATFNIVNVGLTYSPATLTINEGDDVTFTLNSSFHNALEVSLATYNADGIDPLAGGFSVPFGGGSVPSSLLPAGIHYYVCSNHVTLGMKGIIIVQSVSKVPEIQTQNDLLIYPSPAKENITVQFNSTTTIPLEIKLFNLQGRLVDVLFPKTEFLGLLLRTFSLNKATSAGVYVVQLTTGDNTSYKRIIVM
ncbi:MAG: T9SS type A sorting domain-containing protein [Paludibacter sp.]|nr:T9SS type A sorting domain-containing protein [Paludibacter sp.]